MENDPIPGNPGGVLIDLELQKMKFDAESETSRGCLRVIAGGITFAIGLLASLRYPFSNTPPTIGDLAKLGILFGGFSVGLSGLEKYFIEGPEKKILVQKLRTRYVSLLTPAPANKKQ